jgi:hypothetical protein
MGQQLRKIAKRKRLALKGKRKKENIKLAKANPPNKAVKGDVKAKKKAAAPKKAAAKKVAEPIAAE